MKQTTAHAGEDVGKGEHSFIAGRSANLYSHYGNQCGGSLKNGDRTTSRSTYITPGHVSKAYSTIETLAITALFIIARTWKQPKCLPTDE